MLELIAAALEDGWAFVKKGEQVMLLKPPYRQSNVAYVSEDTVQRAVAMHGFQFLQRSFGDWQGLIDFLRAELSKARHPALDALSDADIHYELLQDAPRDVLEEYLRRTEVELLPNREWRAAMDLLTVMMKVDSVRHDAVLFSQALDLLKRCSELVAEARADRDEMSAEGVARRFPLTMERYSASAVAGVMQHVARTHQVFAIGA